MSIEESVNIEASNFLSILLCYRRSKYFFPAKNLSTDSSGGSSPTSWFHCWGLSHIPAVQRAKEHRLGVCFSRQEWWAAARVL